MSKRAAIYVRVSSGEQNTDMQTTELRAAAEQRGWTITEIYEDAGVSGSLSREDRPAFDRLHKDAVRGKFDIVMAWSVDRIGRNLRGLVGFLAEMKDLKVALYLHVQGLDTSTAGGAMMFQMLAIFADFERSMIRERVHSGIERAKTRGVKFGRPGIDAKVEKAILMDLLEGVGTKECVRRHKVAVGTVVKLKKALLASNELNSRSIEIQP